MQKIMDKISVKIFRDFIELENLQSSIKTSYNFAKKTIERVNWELSDFLSTAREEFGMLVDGTDSFDKKRECEYNWLIVPIAGFKNLHRSIPYFCTAMAVEKVNEDGSREIVSCLLENTITKETFLAEKDLGAFVNGRRIRVSKVNSVENAIVSLNLSDNQDKVQKVFENLKTIKINNCQALDLAYLASGKYDGCLMHSPNKYEVAIGSFLVKEAGGYIKTDNGSFVLASTNELLAQNLLEVIK